MEAYDLEGSKNEERIRKLKEKIIDIDPDREYTLAELVTGDRGLRNYLGKQKQFDGIEAIAQLNEAILQLGGSIDDEIDLIRGMPEAKILEFPKKKEKLYSDSEDSVSLYMQQAYHEILTRKEEREAGKRISRARKNLKHLNAIKNQKEKRSLTLETEYEAAEKEFSEAVNYLVVNNLRFAISIARKYYSTTMSLSDRIQEGNIGLMKAAEKFRYRKAKFVTYARYWVNQAIKRALSESNEIRIPLHAYDDIRRIEKIRDELRGNLGKEPTIKEISEKAEFTEEKVNRIFLSMKTRNTSSLQEMLSDSETELGDLIADEKAENPALEAEKNDMSEGVEKELKKLPRVRDEEIVRMRFGIGYPKEYTLEEVGKHFGITRERVRQIETRAIVKLRQNRLHRTALEQFKITT